MLIIVGFIIYFYFGFWLFFDAHDNFANDLKIPTNIDIEKPIKLYGNERDSIFSDKAKTKMDFQLYHSFQPGLYEFDFWCGKIEEGIIYLKVYEITQNKALSEEKVKEKSKLKVYNETDSIRKFGTNFQHITIHEGDWDYPYAARFEVWFIPKKGKSEFKLYEKNYIIEGWQR